MRGTVDAVRGAIKASHDAQRVDELLEGYAVAKRNLYEGGHRLNAVEGGRFCEAAFRLLDERISGSFVPLGQQLGTEKLSRTLAGLPFGSHPESIRIHIPRSLRVVYDIRN